MQQRDDNRAGLHPYDATLALFHGVLCCKCPGRVFVKLDSWKHHVRKQHTQSQDSAILSTCVLLQVPGVLIGSPLPDTVRHLPLHPVCMALGATPSMAGKVCNNNEVAALNDGKAASVDVAGEATFFFSFFVS